jgi:hypothetical protein
MARYGVKIIDGGSDKQAARVIDGILQTSATSGGGGGSGGGEFTRALSLETRQTFTITLATLAAAAGRQSTMIDNSIDLFYAALVSLRIRSGGAAPTAGMVYEVYLLRGDGTIRDDGAGASDAALTVENAPLLGTIVVTANASKDFYGVFDTAPHGPLGSEWGIAVVNATDQALDGTESNHVKGYTYYR